jgi:hypothetical protein
MKRFLPAGLLILISLYSAGCGDTPSATTAKPAAASSAKPPVTAATALPANTQPGTFRVFVDGAPIFKGINPVVEFSEADKKFTFYSTFYTKEGREKFSYAMFELTEITNAVMPEGLDIATDPNIKIKAMVSLVPSNAPNKTKSTYSTDNLTNVNLTTQKYSGILKGRLDFTAQAVTVLNPDFAKHDLRFDFEIPYEKGRLKTFSPGSLEIVGDIGYYRKN